MLKKRQIISLYCLLVLMLTFEIQAQNLSKEIVTPTGIEMLLIPGGSFLMGGEEEKDERPIHKVTVSSFYMDKYEVTQESFEKLTGINPSKFSGKRSPVEQIDWYDAATYCNARSLREGLGLCYDTETWECNYNASGYRLPTEAEWEYACRAGTKISYSKEEEQKLKLYGWYRENSMEKVNIVGQKKPNGFGLYDMHGNLYEWCNDFYQADYYKESPEKDPKGPSKGEKRILRGGSWASKSKDCRSSHRYKDDPSLPDICLGYDTYGFRCVRSALK